MEIKDQWHKVREGVTSYLKTIHKTNKEDLSIYAHAVIRGYLDYLYFLVDENENKLSKTKLAEINLTILNMTFHNGMFMGQMSACKEDLLNIVNRQ